jgi:UDP-2,3-diacylglucosamine pyrophosphatase LpxH
MLVFVSDLHLTDNTTCKTINPGAFSVFADDLRWMTQQACARGGAGCEPGFELLDRVDLVMLGDVFDLLRTNKWREDNSSGVRPWTPEMLAPEEREAAHGQLAEMIERITAETIAKNGGRPEDSGTGISCLRELAEQGIEVHEPGGASHRVPLRIWYMAGNHDWLLHAGWSAYDGVRRQIIEAFGLAHPDDSAFAHTPDDAPAELREVLERHKVFATHGDIYDPDNFPIERLEFEYEFEHAVGYGRRAHASLGDAIVIEVLNGLPAAILEAIDEDDPIREDLGFCRALDELDNVRPLFAMPQWLASVLQRYETGDRSTAKRERKRRHAVREALGQTLHRLLAIPFVQRCDKPWHRDTVDALQIGAALNRLVSLETLSRFSLLHERQARATSYREHAEHELIEMQSRSGQRAFEFIVFGHTHHPEVVPLELDYPRSWIYLNAGTWRRVHRRCVAERRRLEFADYHVMSMVAIYADSERGGRPYETWTGTLGLRADAE